MKERIVEVLVLVGLLVGLSPSAVPAQDVPAAAAAAPKGTGFSEPSRWVAAYGYEQDWQVERDPRMMADVNGDKKADVVGFYEDGVWVSLSTGTGFSKPSLWVDNYGYEKGGWQPDRYLRMTADVNGDKKADVVGFGYPGVWVSVSTGTDFSEPLVWVDYYAFAAGDWRIEKHPRMMADVDGDKKADVVGFYNDGVWVSLSTGTAFSEPSRWVDGYCCTKACGRWDVNKHPRMMADVNGDKKADVVGFGGAGVWVSLSTGTGFSKPSLWVAAYGYDQGWRVERDPRMMADVNGDKKSDVVGFYEDGIWVSLSTGTGFSKPSLWVDNYGYEKGGWQPDRYLRMMADVNGDKKADVVGFGYPGVWISVSTGTDFSEPLVWVDYYAFAAGDWRIEKHPRMMADVDGDKKADVVGFYNDGVWISLSTGIAP